MTVAVGKLDRRQIARLISETDDIKLTKTEIEAFDRCFKMTTSLWAGMIDGKLICTWGLVPPTLLSEQAYLWLYTTPKMHGHEFLFVRHSQRVVEAMLEEYPTITGITTVSLPATIRWLKWLGASFAEPKGKLLPFVIRKKVCNG